MSNALKNVAESTAHVWSDIVDEARDLVDEARGRIEDLPTLVGTRRRSANRRWTVMTVIAALGLLVVVARLRHRHDATRQDSTSGAGARPAEKSLAVG